MFPESLPSNIPLPLKNPYRALFGNVRKMLQGDADDMIYNADIKIKGNQLHV